MRFSGSGFAILFLVTASLTCQGIGRGDTQVVDTGAFVSEFQEANERCFICHGQDKYQYTNESLGTKVKALMCTDRIIKRQEFYDSNHRSFGCIDCHSADYNTFPHPGELRMEQKYNCLDCHGGDEAFAKFNFEEIDAEFRKSVHFKLEEEGFTCWSCHNSHTYKINVRNSDNLKETISYDNNICLHCHADMSHIQLMSDLEDYNILEKHDWLPNQPSHFRSVRCIECHTKLNDSILVSHQILPKVESVRLCNECHSRNSILMASLYKFESKAQRGDGFLNGIILNESYVIGANRNEYLNIISVVIFGLVVLVIGVHIVFRIKKK